MCHKKQLDECNFLYPPHVTKKTDSQLTLLSYSCDKQAKIILEK